jgi:FkbM family methyltransferase
MLGAAQSAAEIMKPLLKPIGLDRLRWVQDLRCKGHQLMLRSRQDGNLLLIEADGHPMYIFNEPHFVGNYIGRAYEPYTVRLFKEAVRPGAMVLDLGANAGYFSLVAAYRAGPQGRVYAFEPGPENFELLLRNIALNKLSNITALPKAVGDVSHTATLTLGELSTHHSLLKPAIVKAKGAVQVECVALDDFLHGATPDVIKIDIEGNEIRSLDGMRRTVEKCRSLAIFVELNPICLREANAEPGDLILKLRELRFDLWAIDDDKNEVSPVTDEYVRWANERPPGWYANLYCTKGLPNPCSS